MSRKEATIIQNFNAEKRKYEYSIKGYDVTKSIEILLKKHKEEYDKERCVFESTKGYLEAQQKYEKHIANLQSQLDQANERLKSAIVSKFKIGQEVWIVIDKMFSNSYVAKFKIKTFIPDRYGIVLMLENKMNDIEYCYEWQVYTTREEAEKKLQELRGGGNNNENNM